MPGGVVEFGLLGPVELSVAGRVVDAGHPRQRTVLAALLVDAGRQVSVESVVDRVWGSAPPRAARRSLHGHLTRIRRLLEQEDSDAPPLVYRAGGYVLQVDPDSVDLHRMRRLAAEARRADRTAQERVQLLRTAVGLWRGQPLAGLPGEWAARTRQSWWQEHLDVVVAWAGAELAVGDGEAAVGRLTELIIEHPLHEPLVAVLMRALHTAGRSAAALEHYAALRERLVDQLGADPSGEVQAVHRAILRGEPEVPAAAPAPTAQSAPPLMRADRTLPADVAGFVGRSVELRHLLDVVDAAAAGGARAVAIHAVDGMAGVGKTAFAVHAAHHLASRFPDGQRFVELRAHAPGRSAVDPATALAILLQAEGVTAQQIPADLDARTALWRERMADKQLLVVLDDAADPAHVTPLLPAGPGCLVLITSRRKLATLPGATMLSLDTLPPADAAQLFTHRAGPRASADQAAVARIVRLCGYLPLAITLTAARLHTHPTWTVADLAADLDHARDRLTELASGDLAVAAAFGLSYRDLPEERKRLFRRLALHTGPDFDAYAAAALDRTTPALARRGLEDLLEHNLLTESRRGRYHFHDLIATHARSQAGSDPQPEQDAAIAGLLAFYQHTAIAAASQQGTGPVPTTSAAVADIPPVESPSIADAGQASEWFTTEQANLAAVARLAATYRHPAAIVIAAALHEHLRTRGPWDLAIDLHQTALTVSQLTDDQPARAQTLANLADMQYLTGNLPAAAAAAEEAQAFYQQLGDARGQATALLTLARVRYITGDYPAAAATAQQAHALHRQSGDRHGQANALNTLARLQYMTGDLPAAAATAEQAHALHEELGNRFGQANTLHILALVQHATGNYPAAAASAEQAHALHEELGNRFGQANTLDTLAFVQHATGDYAAAATAAEQAYDLYRQVGDLHGQAVASNTLARAQYATGAYPAAVAFAERAHVLFEQLGNRLGQANSVQILGIVRHATGDDHTATATLDQALSLFRDVGDLDGEAETLNHIGQLHLDSSAATTAGPHFTTALEIARRIGTPTHEARALEGLGHSLLNQGHTAEGIQRLHDALAIYRRIHSPNTARVETALQRQE